MKNLLVIFILCSFLGFFACEPIGSEIINTENPERTYLDLSVDPVNANGVTAELELSLISLGWEQQKLEEDLYVEGVQFRRASTGETYYQNGYLPAGTDFLWNPDAAEIEEEGDAILMACANVYTHWRWMLR